MTAIFLSLKVALMSVLIVMPVAVFLSRYLTRQPHFIVKLIVESLVMLPLVMPPVATGYLLLLLLGAQSPIGIHLSFTMLGTIVAACTVSLPLGVRSVRISMEGLDPHLEEAAWNLGLTPLETFFHITLPLLWPGILSGAVLVFIRSLGEFGATLIFAGNIEGQSRTLSVALWNSLQSPDGECQALELLGFSVVFGFICLLFSEWLNRLILVYRR